MTLTLTLREAPAAPVDAEALRPDRLAGAEPRPRSSGSSSGTATAARRSASCSPSPAAGEDDVRVEGDLAPRRGPRARAWPAAA